MMIQQEIGYFFEIPLFRNLLVPIVQIHEDSIFFTQLLANLYNLESKPLSCFPFLESIYISHF